MVDPKPGPSPTLQHILASVHRRLILFAVLLSGVTLMISGILVIRGYAERNLALIAHTVGYTVEPAVVFGDMDAVRNGMVSVVGNDAVGLAEVRDRNGRLMASWSRPTNDLASWVERTGGHLLWPSPVIAEVRRGNEIIAVVRVFGSVSGIGSFIISGMLIAFVCLGMTAIATRILARNLQRDIIAPLNHVALIAHIVRTKREFNRRVSISGIVEIDNLGRDFNALLAELERWHTGLTSENETLYKQATQDILTGLGNRALFEQNLKTTIDEAERYQTTFAVLFLDANDFKQINDRYGHDAGDAVLLEIGHRLRRSLRKFDEAFRLGGDEFAIVLMPSARGIKVEGVVERISNAMQPPINLPNGQWVAITLSIGFAIYPDDGAAPDDLLRQADAGMYHDKARRRSDINFGPSHA